MTLAIGVGDIMSCRVWTSINEQAAVNTFNYECISKAGTGCTDTQLSVDRDLVMVALYNSLLPAGANYNGVQIYFLFRTGGGVMPPPENAVASAGPGSATDPAVPRNTAAILKYSTLNRGPRGRGRIYLPFVAAGYVGANARPNGAFDTLVNSFASAQLAPFTVGSGGNTGTFVWVLLHKNLGGPPTIRGQITTALAADKFGTMKKRGDYGRANSSPI